mgnify:CR=1 FL=1
MFPYKQTRKQSAPHNFPAELKTCSHVWIRLDRVRKPLEAPYQGPFQVIGRKDMVYTILMRGKEVSVAVERLKPAKLSPKTLDVVDASDVVLKRDKDIDKDTVQLKTTTKSGRNVKFKKDVDYCYD